MDRKVHKIAILDDKTAKTFSKDGQNKPFVLDSKNSFITDKGVKYLFSAPNSRFVHEIDLSDNYSCITDASLEQLAAASHASSITKIKLKDTDVTDRGLIEMISSPNFNKVQELSLYGLFLISDATMIVLAESYFASGLEKLCLRNTGITDKGIQILSVSQNSSKLVELDISENYPRVSDNSLLAMSVSDFMIKLKILNCMGNRVTDKGLQALIVSKNVLELEELDVSEHILKRNEGIGDQTLRAMAFSNYLRNIRVLNLRSTGVSSKGLIELFASYNCRRLEVLRISNNKYINDITILALMENENLGNLKKVYINDTTATPEAIDNLKKHKPLLDVIY